MDDILSCVFHYLDLNNLANCVQVSKQYNKISISDTHWKRVFDGFWFLKNKYRQYLVTFNFLSRTTRSKNKRLHNDNDAQYIIRDVALFLYHSMKLSNCKLNWLPSGIGLLTSLQELYLHYNKFTSIPTEIGLLDKLTRLTLDGNRLSKLPPEIGSLTNLTELYLTDNQLQELPSDIGQLTNVKILELNDNKLQGLPTSIGHLTKLEKLTLCYNQLQGLPLSIVSLTNLERLTISNNKFQLSENKLKLTKELQTPTDCTYSNYKPIKKQLINHLISIFQ